MYRGRMDKKMCRHLTSLRFASDQEPHRETVGSEAARPCVRLCRGLLLLWGLFLLKLRNFCELLRILGLSWDFRKST